MCCFFTALVFFGPRLALLVWWLLDQVRFALAFTGSFIWPLLLFIFLPWTMIFYLLVFPGGITGFDWIWLGLGLLFDIVSYTGGGYGNRNRIPGYAS